MNKPLTDTEISTIAAKIHGGVPIEPRFLVALVDEFRATRTALAEMTRSRDHAVAAKRVFVAVPNHDPGRQLRAEYNNMLLQAENDRLRAAVTRPGDGPRTSPSSS